MSARNWLGQRPYDVRLEWGPRAAFDAAARHDVVILVDVLSFTTAVTAALDVGATIIPYPDGDPEAAAREAKRLGARLGHDAWGGPDRRRSLSPLGFTQSSRGETYLLCSPNGATCTRIASSGAAVFAGCLRNASAVAAAATAVGADGITVVPCGERWPVDPDAPPQGLRPCVEDHLGAGAIVVALPGGRSPEAELAAAAFASARADLEATLLTCVGGRELSERGYEDDVRFAAALDASGAAPLLDRDRFQPRA